MDTMHANFPINITPYWVEDGAHVLIPQQDIGSHGEFTFYSPHKLLAIPDGSILIQRSKTKVLRELSDNNPEEVMKQI